MNKRIKFVLVLTGLLFWASGMFAELRLAGIFSDNMVLQQGQKVAVWGWAEEGEKITLEFNGQSVSVNAGLDGKWMARLDPMTVCSESKTLSIKSANDKIEVKNVLVGEVWLCAGQSNMAMEVEKCDNFEQEKADANYPLIRMFLTEQAQSLKPENDCHGNWVVCSPDAVGSFSAAAYFFGRELYRKINVPVGLIRSSWGGTIIEAWSPIEALKEFPTVMEHKVALDQKAAEYDKTAEKQKFEQALATWEEDQARGVHKGRKKPEMREPVISPAYPANLYNAMIHPLAPFGIRGAIWYQGESNARTRIASNIKIINDVILYKDILANLIKFWRSDWGEEFPFYFVQLPNFKAVQTAPVEDTAWAFIRESFTKVTQEVPGTGMAISIDVGMEKNVHPTNKQAIGYRLAQQALNKTYGMKDVVACGPVYKSMKLSGDKVIVSFDYTGSGLMAKGGELRRFAVAGDDRKFVNAGAVIADDKLSVEVSAPEVAKPVAVRYAWAENPDGCNLYNAEGLPASPFRTDDWAPVDAGAGADAGVQK